MLCWSYEPECQCYDLIFWNFKFWKDNFESSDHSKTIPVVFSVFWREMIEKIVPPFLRNCRRSLCGNGTADHANGPLLSTPGPGPWPDQTRSWTSNFFTVQRNEQTAVERTTESAGTGNPERTTTTTTQTQGHLVNNTTVIGSVYTVHKWRVERLSDIAGHMESWMLAPVALRIRCISGRGYFSRGDGIGSPSLEIFGFSPIRDFNWWAYKYWNSNSAACLIRTCFLLWQLFAVW